MKTFACIAVLLIATAAQASTIQTIQLTGFYKADPTQSLWTGTATLDLTGNVLEVSVVFGSGEFFLNETLTLGATPLELHPDYYFAVAPWGAGPGGVSDPGSSGFHAELTLTPRQRADFLAHRGALSTTLEFGLTVTSGSLGGVPEPASMALLALGGIALLRRRRRTV